MSETNETGIYIFSAIQTDKDEDFGSVEVEGTKAETFLIRYKDAAMVAAEAKPDGKQHARASVCRNRAASYARDAGNSQGGNLKAFHH